MKIRTKLSSFALAVCMMGSVGLALAPAANADAYYYQIQRSTMAACKAEYRTAAKQLAGSIASHESCRWNKYQRAYVGVIVYNY